MASELARQMPVPFRRQSDPTDLKVLNIRIDSLEKENGPDENWNFEGRTQNFHRKRIRGSFSTKDHSGWIEETL